MIKLSVISFDNKPVAEAASAVFGETGGTVGRGADNHLVLRDPKNIISRTQAFVRSHDERHSITNLSQANPLVLNGVEIGYKEERAIRPNDTLQIGLICLAVETMAPQPDVVVERHDADSIHANAITETMPQPSAVDEQLTADVTAQPGATSQLERHVAADGIADREVLVQAFLRGAGMVDNNVAIDLNADFMEMIGRMLAISIQGAVDQTNLRSLIKREVNADVTMVVVRGNNPIKFLEDGTTVLTQMLRKKMPGFMAPVEAMQDAYEDLYAHQLAVVAGMRAMVADMLTRLDPRQNDEPSASLFNTLLQANSKAKQLESLTARYRDLCREYDGEDAPMFGKAFLDAYEREAEHIRNEADHAG